MLRVALQITPSGIESAQPVQSDTHTHGVLSALGEETGTYLQRTQTHKIIFYINEHHFRLRS